MPAAAGTESARAHLAVEAALYRLYDDYSRKNIGSADCGGFGGLRRDSRVVSCELDEGSGAITGCSCGALRRRKRTTQLGGTHRARQMESGAVGRRPSAGQVRRERGIAGHRYEG